MSPGVAMCKTQRESRMQRPLMWPLFFLRFNYKRQLTHQYAAIYNSKYLSFVCGAKNESKIRLTNSR